MEVEGGGGMTTLDDLYRYFGYQDQISALQAHIAELEERVVAMRNCYNCGHYNDDRDICKKAYHCNLDFWIPENKEVEG